MKCPQPNNNNCTSTTLITEKPTKQKYNRVTWEVCGQRYTYDGVGIMAEKIEHLPNGVYNQFTLENGCITSVNLNPPPIYTPPPCVPVGGITPTSSSLTIDPNINNLSSLTLEGLTTLIFTDNTLIGKGTMDNPLRVVPSSTNGATVVTAGQGITVNAAANAYAISLSKSTLPAGIYNGITFNSLGIATAYSPVANQGLTSVLAGNDIEVNTTNNVATVSMTTTSASSSKFTLGGFDITTTSGGRIQKAEKVINLGGGNGLTITYIDPTDGLVKKMQFNHLGSLTSLQVESTQTSKTVIQQFLSKYNIAYQP